MMPMDRAARIDRFGRVRKAPEPDGLLHYLCLKCGNHRSKVKSLGRIGKTKRLRAGTL